MIGKIELTENWFRIYRGKWVSIIKWVSLFAAFLAAGIFTFVLSVEDGSTFGKSMGLLFSIAGLMGILNVPLYIRIMKDGGDVSLEVNKEGVSISPVMNERMVSFPWRYIAGVAIASTGHTTNTRHDGEWKVGFSRQSYAREKGLLYTKGLRQN